MKANEMVTGQRAGRTARRSARAMILMAVLGAGLFLAGCSDDDCLNCADLPPPVVPTGVHSISGDGYVIAEKVVDGEVETLIDWTVVEGIATVEGEAVVDPGAEYLDLGSILVMPSSL